MSRKWSSKQKMFQAFGNNHRQRRNYCANSDSSISFTRNSKHISKVYGDINFNPGKSKTLKRIRNSKEPKGFCTKSFPVSRFENPQETERNNWFENDMIELFVVSLCQPKCLL